MFWKSAAVGTYSTARAIKLKGEDERKMGKKSQSMRIWVIAVLAFMMMFLFGCKREAGLEVEPPNQAETGLTTPAPMPTPEPEPIIISMVGDCTLCSSQYNSDFEKVVGDDYSWPFSGSLDLLGADDFTIANLECSFSDTPLYGYTTFYFCGPAEYAQILTEGSVECATMGNNHAGDFGQTGIDNTVACLDAAEVSHVLGGEGQIFDVRGMKLGIYVSPWTINGSWTPKEEDVANGVQSLKEQGAEFIIVCCHWGIEGSYRATQSQISVAHAAIDAGANIVCGTHPHVLQKTEEYGDGFIFYSLGNFSFGGNTNPRDKDTIIAQIMVEQEEDGVYRLTEVNTVPYRLTSIPEKNDYKPVPYEIGSEEYERTLSKLDGTFTGADLSVDYSNLTGN